RAGAAWAASATALPAGAGERQHVVAQVHGEGEAREPAALGQANQARQRRARGVRIDMVEEPAQRDPLADAEEARVGEALRGEEPGQRGAREVGEVVRRREEVVAPSREPGEGRGQV